MGGFVATIDWKGPVDRTAFDAMCTAMEHRAPTGMRTRHLAGASLAEARVASTRAAGSEAESLGSLTIVGDVRLIRTRALAELAGLPSAGAHEHRMLLLHAFTAAGPAMMDAVDGDFAFVIWDEEERRLFGARDRFGAKPLWYSRTPTGILIASEPKQIVAADRSLGQPSPEALAPFVVNRFHRTTSWVFEGIDRLRPATFMTASDTATTLSVYWDLRDVDVDHRTDDAANEFREVLIESVRERMAAASSTMTELSGGMDSSSVTASASIVAGDRGSLLQTVSVVLPGHVTDESRWFDATVAMHPWPHHRVIPRAHDLDTYADDMWVLDRPTAMLTRDVTFGIAARAAREGATLVLTGLGGDDVLNEGWVLADLLRTGRIVPWGKGVGRVASDSVLIAAMRTIRSVRWSAPRSVRQVPSRVPPSNSTRPPPHLAPGCCGSASRTRGISLRRHGQGRAR